MNQEYKSLTENKNMEALLLQTENLPILESLLDAESENLQRLDRLKRKNKLRFGCEVDTDELKILLSIVKAEVDIFLDVSSISMPECKYGDSSNYDWESESAILEKLPIVELIPIIGHEYTHHVQKKLGFQKGIDHKIFKEGHARGVERYLSERYRKIEDNEAFMYGICSTTVEELKTAYELVSRRLETPIRTDIFKIETPNCGWKGDISSPTPPYHAMGNVLFLIYETRYGKNIYKDVIHGKFKFPKRQ